MNKDLKEFLKSFNEQKVEYMIVGGIAVAYYGYPRYTGDIDVWVKKSQENAKKIISAVNSFGYSGLDLSVEELTEDNMVFQFGVEPNRIDVITDADGLTYDEAEKNKKKVMIDDVEIFMISLGDLKKNKTASGRHKDLEDLENLP
ncbi:MAG: nucleotidyltransferase [bacterium]